MFIVNNPLARKEAVSRHIKEDTIKEVNFVAREAIVNSNESKEFYRKKLGIPQDRFTVILADGAYAAAKLESYTDELLKTDLPITIIPVCGRNEELFEKYNKIKENVKSNIVFLPQPFLPNVHEYYAASDLFVTKAGPNAITDSVFMHTPILTNFYSSEIEKATNKIFTEDYKMGLYCPDKVEARKLIEDFIRNPEKIKVYQENTYKIDKRNNGADQIADYIAEILGVR